MVGVKYAIIFGTLILIQINAQLDIFHRKTIRIYQFKGKCAGYEKAPIQFKDVKLTLVNRTHYISLKVVSMRNLINDLKLQLTLSRCQSRDALDSCEKYQSIHINRLCDLISGANKPWSPFVKLSEPPVGCPIKKGVHLVNNGTFDGSAFAHLPISGWYWKVQAKIIEENTNLVALCMSMEGQVAPI